jgi:hypothetical protein
MNMFKKPSRVGIITTTIIFAMIQMVIITLSVNYLIELNGSNIEKQKVMEGMTEQVFNESILDQTTIQLQGIREAWVSYSRINETITKSGNLNMRNVMSFLEIAVRPVKNFGVNGNLLVFESESGECIADYSASTIRSKLSGRKLKDLASTGSELNKAYFLDFCNDISLDHDILGRSFKINLLYENGLTYQDSYDFGKYPLGHYNREFIQKIILPVPNISTNRIIILAGVREEAIKYLNKEIDKVAIENNSELSLNSKMVLMSIFCILLSLLLGITVNYILLRSKFCGSSHIRMCELAITKGIISKEQLKSLKEETNKYED